ncbi:hypothetical protein GGI20_005251 [Coemansia sp. BCRC 34301]|nr:hypothetical protein GGI20_005251 [Coemansia sp. BCRC 34301]
MSTNNVHSSSSSSPEVTGDYQHFTQKYSEFLRTDFDPVHYAQRIGGGNGSSDGIMQLMGTLSSGADRLSSLLKHTIISSHSELLQQVVSVRAVDASLEQIEDQVRQIKGLMHGVRTKVREPYEQTQRLTTQASNLRAAVTCVRSVAKFVQLTKRLATQIPPNRSRADYALASLTLLDIERLVEDSELNGVDLVDRALAEHVDPLRTLALAEAQRLVDDGMQRQHLGDVAAGLQILGNLGVLPGAVAATVRAYTVEWAAYVSGTLDPHLMQSAVRDHNAQATANDGSDMIGITGVLWARIEDLADALAKRALEMRTLERVLTRKRNEDAFLGAVVALLGNRPMAFWWGTAVAALAAQVDSAFAGSPVIGQALINGYPRLVQVLVPRLEHVMPADSGPAVLWDRLLAKYEAEYVLRAAARINDAVGRCFPPAQTVLAANGVVRSISTELNMAKPDARLSAAVARAAAAATASFVATCNSQLKGVRASLVSAEEPASLCVCLANSAEALRSGLLALNAKSEYDGQQPLVSGILDTCVCDLQSLIGRLVTALLEAADAAIAESIITSGSDQGSVVARLAWLQTRVIEPLETDSWRGPALAMITRHLCLYTHVACLEFPLTEAAKLRLTADAAQFEFACSQLIPSADLGRSYRALRLLRPLLFTDTMELLSIVRGLGSQHLVWSDLLPIDLISHVVCRLATDLKDGVNVMPYSLLGWSKRRWIELLVTSTDDTGQVGQALSLSLDKLTSLVSETSMEQLLNAAKQKKFV